MEGGIIDSGSVIVASLTPMWVWVMAVSTMLGLGDMGTHCCGRQTTLGLGECRCRLWMADAEGVDIVVVVAGGGGVVVVVQVVACNVDAGR